MRLTHFGHSCVLVELNGSKVLLDPGNFSHGFEGITGLDAILITHQHPDHVDTARLPDLVAHNPGAALYADPQTAAQLGNGWRVANAGDTFDIGDVHARVAGGRHAVIHPDIPVIDNVGYLLGSVANPGQFLHPGDSLLVPEEQIDVLAVPAAAPWMKISETIDYLRAVRPRVAVPIHQGVLSDAGLGIYYGRLREMSAVGTEFRVVPAEDSLVVS